MNPRLWRFALWCAAEELRARHAGKLPGVQPWNAELVRALELELAVSSTRHESACSAEQSDYDDDDPIGTLDAARLLGWSMRRVQRHAGDLDGHAVGGRLVFQRTTVIEYREAMNGRDIA